MTSQDKRFRIGRRVNSDRYLHVHIRDIATAVIKDEEQRIVVDIFPFKDYRHAPNASISAHLHDLCPEEQPPLTQLTPWQITALSAYDDGAFTHMADIIDDRHFHEELRDCGDSLLRFIVNELSEAEGCSSFDVAVRRITTARNQLDDLIVDLQEETGLPPQITAQPRFRVSWRIELDASNPRDAAQQALAIHRDNSSNATHFTVHDTLTGETTSVDLDEAPRGE